MANTRDYIYVAFDADALSLLAKVHQMRQNGEYIDHETNPDALIRKYAGYAIRVLDLIYSGEIRPFVVNTIYQQTHFMDFIKPFITEYCYFPHITAENRYEKRQRIKRLAEAYCAPYVDGRGITKRAPMDSEYNAYFDVVAPESDAVAMAEATEENCYFVTCNEKHFLWFKGREDKMERMWGIITINRVMDFGEQREQGVVVPKPMGFGMFGPLIRDGIREVDFLQPEKAISAKTGEMDDLTK